MLLKTRGIVFRAIKYGDTSVIADIFTREEGLRTFIIGGVRKQKSNFSPGLLQVMSIVDLVAYFKVDKEMHRVKEMMPAQIYSGISFNVVKNSVGLFMIEVAQKCIKESEQNYPLYDWLENAFVFLDQSKTSLANYPLGFLLGLSSFLGFQPEPPADENLPIFDLREGQFVSHSPGHLQYLNPQLSKVLLDLLPMKLAQIHTFGLEKESRKQLLFELIVFYRLHVEHFQEVRSLKILETILSA